MKRFGIVAAQSKDEAALLAEEISRWFGSNGCIPVDEQELRSGSAEGIEAIVVLGGDGLMMRAANSFPDVPLLGINFGKVGFLAMVERREWLDAISALVGGAYEIQESATLAARLDRGPSQVNQGWSINDVVIRGGVRMIDVEVYIDGHYVNTYPGDGMIVATPRGSTAYCMAAGGPILTAGVRGFAIVPISCHSPIRTPLVSSETSTIELYMANRHEALLILDGRQTADLGFGDVIRVASGNHKFRLISLGSTNFYEAFRTKFNFRIRPDAVPSRPVTLGQPLPNRAESPANGSESP